MLGFRTAMVVIFIIASSVAVIVATGNNGLGLAVQWGLFGLALAIYDAAEKPKQ